MIYGSFCYVVARMELFICKKHLPWHVKYVCVVFKTIIYRPIEIIRVIVEASSSVCPNIARGRTRTVRGCCRRSSSRWRHRQISLCRAGCGIKTQLSVKFTIFLIDHRQAGWRIESKLSCVPQIDHFVIDMVNWSSWMRIVHQTNDLLYWT
jgi:hypothetical protein